jgi:hypothetical protein
MGEIRNAYKILVRKPEGNDYFGDMRVDGRQILKWILKKQSVSLWTGFI